MHSESTERWTENTSFNNVYSNIAHLFKLWCWYSLYFAGIVLNKLECKLQNHREELRIWSFPIYVWTYCSVYCVTYSCISLIAQKLRRFKIQTPSLFWRRQSKHGSATEWRLQESWTLWQSIVNSEEIENASSSAVCVTVLVGPVGEEGEVGGIGDGRGAGWPISLNQHLDCQQLVERPWVLVPPTEHMGE